MKTPLLTVCLITYNHAEYIRKSIDSILEQTTKFPWVLVVADDYSTDGTREILKEYQQEYPERIHLILQKKNVGPEDNWHDLLAAVQTKYMLYGEGDDYFIDATKLQKQVEFLESHNDFSMCFHPVRVIYSDKSWSDELFPTPEQRSNKTTFSAHDLLLSNFMQTNSVMYRWKMIGKVIIKNLPKGITPGDWYLHLYHAQFGKIGFIDNVMSVYCRNPGGLWWNTSNGKIDDVWKKYGIGHIALYSELMKIYGHTSKNRKIIDNHIVGTISAMSRIDLEQNTKLVKTFTNNYPENNKIIVLSLSRSIYLNNKSQDLLEEKIRTLEKKMQEEVDKNKGLKREMEILQQDREAILNSKVYKTGLLVTAPYRSTQKLLRGSNRHE